MLLLRGGPRLLISCQVRCYQRTWAAKCVIRVSFVVAKQNGISVAKPSPVLSCLNFQNSVLSCLWRWFYLPKLVGRPARDRATGESPLPPCTPGSVFSLSSFHLGIPVQHHIILQKIRIISSRDCVLNDCNVTFAFQKQIFVPIEQCKLQVTHSIY